jgi:hypothetical protein
MRVVFLDFDGPLVPIRPDGKKTRPAVALPGAVDNLNDLVTDTGASVVISSSWRIANSLLKLNQVLKKWGCGFEAVDKTPSLKNSPGRGVEIWHWLCMNRHESFVVLDDEDLEMGPVLENLVKVDGVRGFTAKDAEKSREILLRCAS